MSTIVWEGSAEFQSSTGLEQVENTITMDELGVAKQTVVYECLHSQAVKLVQSKQGANGDYDWLVFKSANISRLPANAARVQIVWEGVEPGDGDDTIRHSYTLTNEAQEFPIETHPNFDTFAATAEMPAPAQGRKDQITSRGMIYNAKNQFVGFAMKTEGKNYYLDNRNLIKAGVTSWVAPTVIYTHTEVSGSLGSGYVNDLNSVGKIDNPPSSDILPDVSAGRTWLNMGMTAETIGNGFRRVTKWKLSGPDGWDREIYGVAQQET